MACIRPPRMASVGRVFLAVLGVWSIAGSGSALAADFVVEEKYKFKADLEYRVRTLHIERPLLADAMVKRMFWTEQRFRIDLGFTYDDFLRIHSQLDVLDGGLFGDNGVFGGVPSPNSGVSVTVKRPNDTTFDMDLVPGADPFSFSSYAPRLRGLTPIQVNRIWAEVVLPFGILRVGRQPFNQGAGITSHEGLRVNRWGVSRYADTADRVLIATKLDEAVRFLADTSHTIDPSPDRGLFLAFFHDWMTQGMVYTLSDDTRLIGGALIYKLDRAETDGVVWRDVLAQINVVNISNDRFRSNLWGIPIRAGFTVDDFTFSAETVTTFGRTKEISEGFATLSRRPATWQRVLGVGARVAMDYRLGPVEFSMEFDYASGDDDPRYHTPLTTFSFARDQNVGLLLFEYVLALQSARSAAVGIENLKGASAKSFPLTEIRTEGRFTNAIAIFPQFTWYAVNTERHQFHLRAGVLVAWPAAKGGGVDPIRTVLAEDGAEIRDDAVNYWGGPPGHYYGTEVDLQLQWTFRKLFMWTVEGAVLFPGSSLKDDNGDTQTAGMIENRFTFLF